jgi:malic enzyme
LSGLWTAIVSVAALMNAIEMAGKQIDGTRGAFSGAGESAVGRAEHHHGDGRSDLPNQINTGLGFPHFEPCKVETLTRVCNRN